MKKLAIMLGTVAILTGCGSKPAELTEGQIGYNTPKYIRMVNENDSPIGQDYNEYYLQTPRGVEVVAGDTNLHNSIHAYKMYRVFGKLPEELNQEQKEKFRVK